MSSAVRRFLASSRSTFFPLICLMALLMPALRAVDEVDVDSDQAVAYREGMIDGEFTIVRGGSASPVDVSFQLGGGALIGIDYDISIDGGATITTGTTFIASMAAGVQQVTVQIIPLPTPNIGGLPRGQVHVNLAITPSGSAYSIGAGSVAAVIIADNSLSTSLTLPTPLASDDPTLSGVIGDSEQRRRGIVKVGLLKGGAQTPIPDPIFRNVQVSIGGTAALNTKYKLYWKVGGSNIGNGQGFALTYYYQPRDSAVGVVNIGDPVNEGDAIAFTLTDSVGNPTNYTSTYTGQSTSTLTGPAAIFGITSAGPFRGLAAPVLVGSSIFGMDTTTNQPVEFVVTQVQGWLAQSTTIEVAGGVGIFSQGDVISFAGTPGLYYVLPVAPSAQTIDGQTVWTLTIDGSYADADATLTFPTDHGLAVSLPLGGAVLGEFPIISSPSNVILPPTASQVEYSVEPTLNNPPTGAQTVILTMSQSYDYNMTTPTVGSVIIADSVVQANVTLGSNASQPNTAGSFLLTLTQPFPSPINVPYTILNDGNAAFPGTDYVPLTGILTIPAGQTSVTLPVTPIATDAILPPGGRDVGVILSGSFDYKLAGSGTTLTNPSATLNIAPSQGTVGISASSAVAFMNPSAPGSSTFNVSIARSASSNQAVIVNYTVGGSAIQGVDYTPLTATTSAGYATTGSVTIPAGQNSASITILPIEDPISTGVLQVVLTLTGGQGYTINPTNVSAAVNIQSDTPTLSVTAGGDASQPSTPGTFVISYPGVPAGTALNHPLTVTYTLSGTAVVGKDYANPGTVTIPAGTTSVTVQIVPSNNPLTTDKSVTLTINPAPTYAIGANQGSATIALHFMTPPASGSGSGGGGSTGSGQASYSSSGGGCGIGGGMGLLVFALALSKRRR